MVLINSLMSRETSLLFKINSLFRILGNSEKASTAAAVSEVSDIKSGSACVIPRLGATPAPLPAPRPAASIPTHTSFWTIVLAVLRTLGAIASASS